MSGSGPTRRQFGRMAGAVVTAGAAGALPHRALAADTIRIASVDSFSGPVGNLGHGTFNGEQIAVDRINAAGGIKALGGRKLELLRYDTQGSVPAGQAAAEKAIQDGAVALIGTCQSNVTLATTTVAERARIPQLVSGSTAPEITSRGYKFTFRVLIDAAAVSSHYIDSFQELYKQAGVPLKTILCLYEDGAYGQSSYKAYVEGAARLGLTLNGIATKTGSSDFSSVVAQARQAKPDLLMFVGYTNDSVTLVTALREANADFPLVYLSTGPTDPEFIKAAGPDDAAGFLAIKYFDQNVKPQIDPDGPAKFYAAYKAKFGEPGYLSGQGYVSVLTIAMALEAAGSTDGGKLRDALAAVELTAADGNVMPYKSVKFDATGQNVYANAPFAQVGKGGETYLVSPAEYAVRKVQIPMPRWQDK